VSERDDEAWRAIVDNYGERAELDPDDELDVDVDVDDPDPGVGTGDEVVVLRRDPRDDVPPELRTWDEESIDSDWTTDRFVPPPPPPVPTPTRDRFIAWAGVFGSPAILLVCLAFRIEIPQLIAYLLVAGFVGGFLYLVLKMPREPRDPGDDGAVL
jgi:hypothetical protein